MQFVREKINLVNEGVINDFYKNMGMSISLTAEPDARQVKGHAVDRYRFEIQFLDPEMASAADQAMINAMLKDQIFEMAQVGPYVAYSMGEPLEALVDRLYAGGGGGSSPAVQAFSGGGVAYVEINPNALRDTILMGMNFARTMNPAVPMDQVPEIAAGAPPLVFAGFHQQGKGYYRLRVPRGLLTAIQPAVTPAQ